MSKKEDKKGLMKRLIDREEVNLADYTMKEIEEVVKELVELRIDRVRTEEAIKLLDAVAVAVGKVREILVREEKEK